jgi:hypothetical protein
MGKQSGLELRKNFIASIISINDIFVVMVPLFRQNNWIGEKVR